MQIKSGACVVRWRWQVRHPRRRRGWRRTGRRMGSESDATLFRNRKIKLEADLCSQDAEKGLSTKAAKAGISSLPPRQLFYSVSCRMPVMLDNTPSLRTNP